jgi:Phage integrase, N-terminal SAM-like domain
MTTIESAAKAIRALGVEFEVDAAQVAAVSFLARYSRRTLEAFRHDLRGFFEWATDHGVAGMEASRAHIELFRAWMEDRGLAASTLDRRLSTVCGFYRFAHIDGRIRSNPAQYVRRPQVHATDARGLDRSELGVFLSTADQYDRHHAALAVLRTGGSARSGSVPGSAACTRTCCEPRSSWPPSTPGSRCETSRSPLAHADPRTTTIHDRRRQNFDRHAAYIVVAFVADG